MDRKLLTPLHRWRLRHACPDAVALWRMSTGPNSDALAFNAVALDAGVLRRPPPALAAGMAAKADHFAASLAPADDPAGDLWAAAAQFVRTSIDAWRRSPNAHRYAAGIGSLIAPGPARLQHSDPWA